MRGLQKVRQRWAGVHSSVVECEEEKRQELQSGVHYNDNNLVDTDEADAGAPPEHHEDCVLQSHDGVVHGVPQPRGTVLDVDNVEDEDRGNDDVVHELGYRPPGVVHGAAEVGPHGKHPHQHAEVVEDEEDEELVGVEREEEAEDEHSA